MMRSRSFPSTAAVRSRAGRAKRFRFPSMWPRKSAGHGGRLGRRLKAKGEPAVNERLQIKYPVDQEASEELVDLVKKQIEKNLAVPDDSHIVVESGKEGAIINSCFGHKTNDTLGRVITSILSARFGSSVALEIDPYRIQLTLPKPLLAEEICKADRRA